jgi:hypothetical protein
MEGHRVFIFVAAAGWFQNRVRRGLVVDAPSQSPDQHLHGRALWASPCEPVPTGASAAGPLLS